MRGQEVNRKPPVDLLTLDDIKQSERKAGQMPVSVGDRDRESGRLIGHDEIGHMPMELQSPETALGEETGDDDQAEHHREEQVKQIVAGIDGGEPDPECKKQKPRPFRGETNRSPSGHSPDEGEHRETTEGEEWVRHASPLSS